MKKPIRKNRGRKRVKKNGWNKFSLALILAGLLLLVGLSKFMASEASIRVSSIQAGESSEQKATSPSATLAPKADPKEANIKLPVSSGRSVNVPILYYHYIGENPDPKDVMRDGLSISPDKFQEQMSFLSESGYTTLTFDTLYAVLKGEATLPSKPIILTFDDGYIDFYVNAFPILRRYNLQAVVFVPTGLVGKSYYLSWDQIKTMDATGLISFQAHSVDHLSLPTLTPELASYQIAQSKKDLENILGKPVNTFAYPYGTSNQTDWELVKQAGFLGAVGTWRGITENEGMIFNMPRIKIGGAWDLDYFAANI